MEQIQQIRELGTSLGYEDEELRMFVKDQQDRVRDERAALRQDQKEERDRKAGKDKALIEKAKIENELELQKLMHAKKMEELSKQAELPQVVNTGGSHDTARGPKIPPFEEGNDEINSYRRRFERYATAQKWQLDIWATHLSALLKGKAFDVYALLPVDKVPDFAALQDALLKRYDMTENGFKRNQSNSSAVKSLNGQKTVDNARKEQRSKLAERTSFISVRDRKCFRCGKTGHIALDCGVNLQKTSSALSEDKNNFKGKIYNTCTIPTDSIVNAIPTGCTCTLPSSCQSITNLSMPVSSGYVDGKPVTVLRDTGCSGIVVKRDMVDNKSLTDGKQQHTCAVETREQVRNKSKPYVQLKVKDIITDEVNPNDIKKDQLEDTTLDKIRRCFSFCQSCDICQRIVPKRKIGKVPLQSMPLIDESFKRVAVDLIGPLFPRADRGIKYILTLVDYGTRYPEAIALKDIETESVAEALVDIFSRIGVPQEMLTDMGSQFTSRLMAEVSRLISLRQLTTTVYHPMFNGLVERFNGSLKLMLKRMCHERPKD
ncbi:unnamed protein product [Mytilus coruscus]|uniref:CCHC-type domain-containing protein n=1 Tax=Mytilus coruscus TaxID=42192 RepID=A0A6J8EQY4_MYTCO|nr:unnamed protein product [Mytilus coruscus]